MEEPKDVNVDSSPVEQEVVNQPETDQQVEQVDQSQEAPSTQEVKPEVEKPDRPEINYAMEAARKASEALDIVRQMQQQQQQPPQQEQPQYTKAQLRAFAETTTDANHKVWALEEIDKLDKTERQAEIRQLFEGQQKKSQEEMTRQQSLQFVVNNFPDIAIRDTAGNFAGFNQNSELYKTIDNYMRSNPELAKSPQGLIAAAKMAAFDLGVSMNRKLSNKINATTAQLRKEQKKQLISGGGSSPQAEGQTTKLQKLAEDYRRTGSRESFKQLAKMKGLIPEIR